MHTLRSVKLLRSFDSVKARALADIWSSSEALLAYRGEAWMPEPCKSCDRKAVDFGGCRCQAFALTGDASATDPACQLAPQHADLVAHLGRLRLGGFELRDLLFEPVDRLLEG